MTISHEKRQYPRVTLNVEDGYFGNFILPDNSSLMASVVNISAGGVNFSAPSKVKDRFKEGDILLLKRIAGATRLAFIEDIKAEVRWIKALGDTGVISVGCRFHDLSAAVRDQMVRFVDSERTVRGQYD